MDREEPAPNPITRRDFLRAAGLSLGALCGAGIACGRAGQAALPTATASAAPTLAETATGAPTMVATATGALPTVAPPTASPPTAPPPTAAPPTATAAPTATVPPETAADLAFVRGKVITVDGADTIAQAVAVRGGRIQAVGRDDEIQALVGPATKTIDLKGRAVTPGLIDAHNHMQVVGQMESFYEPFLPPEVKTMADLQARLAEAAAQTPAGEWILGYFLGVTEARLPNRHDLDPVSPKHPVWLMQQGGHYGSANSLALQAAGISAATADPVGGVIEREADGEPTGVFYNHRAMDLVRVHMPLPTAEMTRGYIVDSQSLFAACGVTSFQDNNVRGPDTIRSYQEIGREGQMLLRGSVYYTLEWPKDLDRALKEIDYGGGDEFMHFAGFKFLIDGQAKMAFCHEPHSGTRWDLPTWEPNSFKQAVRALHDTGLQICVHCAGDAAVDLTLDAYEEAMNANPRPDPRHRIEHCILTTPQATQRMRDLGVVVCTQPQFIRLTTDGWVSQFGEERAARAIVTREWLDNGVHVALGSDAPTTPWLNPQMTLAGAVARATATGQRHHPEQALTADEALRAHTMGAAYAGHEETVKGSIEVGKMADLAVWHDDPTTASMKTLGQITVDMTVIGGQVVYQG